MQTFLPYSNFWACANVLDWRRLGKQRVEGMQILNAIENKTGWKNHPIVRMWNGFEECLKLYINVMIDEWISRNFNNSMVKYDIDYNKMVYPDWLGNKDLHSSHKAALLFKDLEWYNKFGWSEEPKINYVWMV